MADTQVLIVGAGPVGLTLAVDLGKRGIRCVLLGGKGGAGLPAQDGALQRPHHGALPPHGHRPSGCARPACRATSRWTCSSSSRWSSRRCCGSPIHRSPQAEAEIAATTDASQPLEPYQLISQYTLEPLLKSIAEELPTVSVRYGHELTAFHRQRQFGHGPYPAQRRHDARHLGRLPGRLRRRHQRGAQAARHQAAGRRQYRPVPPGALSLRRSARPHSDRQGAALSRRRRPIELPDHAGFDEALHAACDRRQRRRDEDDVREGRGDAGRLRDAVLRALEAEPAARRQLRTRARSAGRRRRPSGDPDRRARHEHRRRRRGRSRLEAVGHPQGLGRAEPAQVLRDRAPPGRRAQRRGLAFRGDRPAQVARHVPARTSATIRRRARRRGRT